MYYLGRVYYMLATIQAIHLYHNDNSRNDLELINSSPDVILEYKQIMPNNQYRQRQMV